MTTSPVPTVPSLVSARVLEALRAHTAPFAGLGEPIEDLLAPARDLLGGGKRLRAEFCAAGWAGFSDEPALAGSPPILAGAAIELFQGAALVHDDVMDGSHTRRGMPAVHRRLAAEHAAAGWLGSADRYGEAGAILLGDLLLSVSSMEIDRARAAVGPGASARAREVWDLMTSEVAVGQYLDIRSQAQPWAEDGAPAVEMALEVVRMKSARYSVEHPLTLGAALAGADDDALARLRAVGLPLGEAFQLRDDVLGVFGDPALTGKPAGDDLREGKRTVLLGLAMHRADPPAREHLRTQVGRADLTDDDVARLQEILVGSGAVAAHEDLIAERLRVGLAELERADLPDAVSEELTRLADALAARQA
ncbi:polyprenyl synthetase family protein [Georgenia faecalis]|uniref:polyprenyl synthetase family protein n=1 Tax=Georgenia faecalis TaxID=2483799 RepID=UPI000FD6C712|nr:polyprenyl synthetase family protein [Georgenia faecalis]